MKLIYALLVGWVLLSAASVAQAAAITINANTNWSAIVTGSGAGGQPAAADTITVQNGATLTVNVASGVCAAMQLGGTAGGGGDGTLRFNAASAATVSGIITLGASGGGGPRSGSIVMTSGGTLSLQGFNVAKLGTWTEGTGTVVFTATNTLPNETGMVTFYNLNVNGGTTTLFKSPTMIKGSLTVSAGATIDTSNRTLSVVGNLVVNGTVSGTGVITLDGTAAQTISGANPAAFTNLTVNNAANPNITLATNVTVSGTLGGTVMLASTCPVDYTLTSTTPAQVLHSCSGGPDHLEIRHGSGTGLTCAASTLTVRACADAACATPYTAGVSGTLSATGAPTVNWDGTTGGAAGAGFLIPSGSSSVTKNVQVATAGTVVFGIVSPSPVPTGATTCNFGTPSCTFTASTAGFIFSSTTTGGTYTIPPQVSGIATSTLYLRAVQASTTNPAVCTPAIVGQTTAVNMGYTCNNPVACQAGSLATINATAIASGGTSVTLTFDANGSAPITVRYDDVGRITLNTNKTVTPFGGSTPITLTGSSNAFVVAPHHFGFSGITAGLIKAGNNFSATVTAYNGLGAPTATANFGKEVAPEGVTLTPNLASGNNPALVNNAILGGSFSSGAATVINLNWGEVGLITLTANLTSGSYLGSGLSANGTSGNVGPFIPDHLDTAVVATATAPMPCPASLTCPTLYNGMVYSGQPFSVQATARNLAGVTTTNYDNALGYSRATTLTAWDALGSIVTPNPGGGVLANNSILAAGFSAGVATTATPTYTLPAATTAPTDIYMRADDADGVSSRRAASPGSSVEGGVKVASGRINFSNTYGSELLPLTVPAIIQYWDGAGYVTSATDDFTTLADTNILLSNWQGNLSIGETSVSPVSIVFASGVSSIILSAPGVGNDGRVDITSNSPVYLPGNSVRAAFGVYGGKDIFIYRGRRGR